MITGEAFIALAGKLAAPPQVDEAACRTAVSRSYYGAFHLIRQFLILLEIKPARDHGELQRMLMQSGHSTATEVGNCLVDLHSSRVKADYDLANVDVASRGFAQECVELASDIRASVRQLEADNERQRVKIGIEAYLQRIGR